MNSSNLNLLTVNTALIPFIWHSYKRIELLSKQQGLSKADILNLQEVHTYDMLWALRYKLSEFSYISFKPGLLGPKAGLVSFSKTPFTGSTFTSFGHRKGVLISELTSGIILANIHLIANTDGDWSPQNRFYPRHKSQLDQLNTLLDRPHYKNKSLIVSGDFNLAKTCDLYKYFIDKGGWQDTAKDDFSPTFHGAFLPNGREPQRIDYIFTRGNIVTKHSSRIFEQKIDGRYLSNHMGLSVELSSK